METRSSTTKTRPLANQSFDTNFVRHKPIISIKEARKILGKSYDKYPDEAIERLISNLDGIIEAYIISVPKF